MEQKLFTAFSKASGVKAAAVRYNQHFNSVTCENVHIENCSKEQQIQLQPDADEWGQKSII